VRRRRIRRTRKERSTAQTPLPGTRAIATTRKSKTFHPLHQKRNRNAASLREISTMKIARHILSTRTSQKPYRSIRLRSVSKPRITAFTKITAMMNFCTGRDSTQMPRRIRHGAAPASSCSISNLVDTGRMHSQTRNAVNHRLDHDRWKGKNPRDITRPADRREPAKSPGGGSQKYGQKAEFFIIRFIMSRLKNFLQFSRERKEAGSWLPPWTDLEHYARYEFCKNFVGGKIVVDCACGSGESTAIFAAMKAKRVIGIDIDISTIEEKHRRLENIEFIQSSAEKLPLSSDFADCFISLETIEHIDQDVSFLNEIYRILKPGGLFICSTPNRDITNPGTSLQDKPINPYHVREYNLREFTELIQKKFHISEILGQNPNNSVKLAILGALARFNKLIPILINKLFKCRWFLFSGVKSHAVQHGKPGQFEYFVAVARKPEDEKSV
jgi:SAM-dependent methyltransferase